MYRPMHEPDLSDDSQPEKEDAYDTNERLESVLYDQLKSIIMFAKNLEVEKEIPVVRDKISQFMEVFSTIKETKEEFFINNCVVFVADMLKTEGYEDLYKTKLPVWGLMEFTLRSSKYFPRLLCLFDNDKYCECIEESLEDMDETNFRLRVYVTNILLQFVAETTSFFKSLPKHVKRIVDLADDLGLEKQTGKVHNFYLEWGSQKYAKEKNCSFVILVKDDGNAIAKKSKAVDVYRNLQVTEPKILDTLRKYTRGNFEKKQPRGKHKKDFIKFFENNLNAFDSGTEKNLFEIRTELYEPEEIFAMSKRKDPTDLIPGIQGCILKIKQQDEVNKAQSEVNKTLKLDLEFLKNQYGMFNTQISEHLLNIDTRLTKGEDDMTKRKREIRNLKHEQEAEFQRLRDELSQEQAHMKKEMNEKINCLGEEVAENTEGLKRKQDRPVPKRKKSRFNFGGKFNFGCYSKQKEDMH